ncbi:MAG: hypothetical protein ACRYFK_06515 [Janthinobacterium lividum]
MSGLAILLLLALVACSSGTALAAEATAAPVTAPRATGGVCCAKRPARLAAASAGMVWVPGGTFAVGVADHLGRLEAYRRHQMAMGGG